MPMSFICSVLALALFLRAASSHGFRTSDLYKKNYDDPMVGLWCTGLTASGFEQGAGAGRSQYIQPSRSAIDYFHERGSNCFRVPITWERLQSSRGSTELDPVLGFVDTIKYISEDLDDYAIVVPYEGAGGGLRFNNQNADMEDFVNLWTAISKQFAQNDRVIFELYNYPQYGCHNENCGSSGVEGFFGWGDDTDGAYVRAWLEWCQGAVDAIRAQEASNYVIVPGLKQSSCRDWTGAQFWGENLDGEDHRGNLRLFALNDTAMRIAYSVHQYFDTTLSGLSTGCGGHDHFQYAPTGWAADEALIHTIAMAQKYNKKLWLTEVASFPDPDASSQVREGCQSKMDKFLSTMSESGVFLGYQAWQFGCETCGQGTQDLWTMPDDINNLEWYDLDKYGITSTNNVTTNTSTTVTTTVSTGLDRALPARPGMGLLVAAVLMHQLTC